MRRLLLAPLLLAALTPAAEAQGKKKTACGVTILPLAVGNQWTYSWVAAPTPATPEIARITPPAPKGFVITVKNIETKGADTVISLEEKLTYDYSRDPTKPKIEERTINSTITCGAKKFDISPDSFFFAGEPGGYLGSTIDKLERKGTSWQITKGGFGDAEWREDLIIEWTKVPFEKSRATHGKGRLEMERQFTPAEPEKINTKVGVYTAEKIGVLTTGRVTLEAPLSKDLKPMELPKDWLNVIWLVPNTGVVQVLNRYAHMYQLVDSQLK